MLEGASKAEVRRRFGEAERRDHLNGAACYAMIQATARKWGGSHAAMFEFARWVSSEAPDGHPGHWMIALAYIEGWIDAHDDDFWRMKHYDATLAQMQIIGIRVTPAPWLYAGTPSDVFERVRQAGLRMAR